MLGACAVVSIVLMVGRLDDRSTARSFAPVADGEPAAIQFHTIPDIDPSGDQIFVHWLRVVDPGVTIPGVPSNPEPDSWFVSPALAGRMANDRLLEQRFPGATTIGPAGVVNADELLAYRFVGPDVPLSNSWSARHRSGASLAGSDTIDAMEIVRPSAVLLGLPIIGLLIAGIGPAAAGLEARLGLLEALGAPRRSRKALVFLRAALSSVPGAIVGGLVWMVVSPRLTSVPLVGQPTLRGDLAVAPILVAVVMVGVVMFAGIVAAVRPLGAYGNRPTTRIARRPRAYLSLALVSGVGLMAIGSGIIGTEKGWLYMTGLAASLVGTVVALPVLLSRAGEALASGPSVLWTLVGRRLRWQSSTSARGLVAFGALVTIVPVAVMWIQHLRDEIGNDAGTGPAAGVLGSLPLDEIEQLSSRTDSVVVEMVSDPTAAWDPRYGPPPLRPIADCRTLARVVELARCDDQGFRFVGPVEAKMGSLLDGLPTRPEGARTEVTFFFSQDPKATDAALRAYALNRQQPGFSPLPIFNPLHEAPVIRWAVGGLGLAALLGGLALAFHLATQAIGVGRSRIVLNYVGADVGTIRRLAGTEAFLTIALSGVLCLAVGMLASWLFKQMNPDAEMQVGPLVVLSIVVAGVGVVSAAGASLSVGKQVQREGD